MQEEPAPRKGILDRMTLGIIKRYSRRGLLSNLGKKGLVLASATGLAGIALGIDTPLAIAAPLIVTHASVPFDQAFEADPDNPDCITHPPPCNGACIHCGGETSSCTTGGARCTISINCSCCLEYGQRAYGSYDCFGHFHCTSVQC